MHYGRSCLNSGGPAEAAITRKCYGLRELEELGHDEEREGCLVGLMPRPSTTQAYSLNSSRVHTDLYCAVANFRKPSRYSANYIGQAGEPGNIQVR